MAEITQTQDTRRVFVDTLIELAEKDEAIALIVPDVGFNYLEAFQSKFPTRFYNLGVTEQSCIIIAAAMALSGLKPYVYSMINFVAFRPFEMVRNAVALHKANVKLLGVKGSEKYKFLGFSHNMVVQDEDKMHLEPYVPCYLPSSPSAVREAILETYQSQQAAYIRL